MVTFIKVRFIKMKRIPLLALLLAWAALALAATHPQPSKQSQMNDTQYPPIRLAFLSDIHVMAPSLIINDGKAATTFVDGDRKLLRQSAAIFSAICDSLIEAKPDLLIISGDLTKDGETASHQCVREQLDRLRLAGIPSLVIPGNHDIDNTQAFLYDGDHTQRAPIINRADFADIYKLSGYGNNFPAAERDTTSLSYVCEPLPGLVVIGIDTNEDEGKTVVGPGRIKPSTLTWLLAHAQKATKQGKRVLAVMHHHLIPHFDGEATVFRGGVVAGYEQVKEQFMAAGIHLVTSGHFHVTDIAMTRSAAGNDSIVEIANGSTVSYPLPYRIVTLEGDRYRHLNCTTHHVTSIPGDPDVSTHAREALARAVKARVGYMFKNYYNRARNKAAALLGGQNMVDSLLQIHDDATLVKLAQDKLVEPLTQLYIIHAEGDEHHRDTQQLVDQLKQRLDDIIVAAVRPEHLDDVRSLVAFTFESRLGKTLRSLTGDLNNVDTPAQVHLDDNNIVLD